MSEEEKPSQTPREAIRRASRISAARDSVRDNPPPPPNPEREISAAGAAHSGIDGAVLAVSELLFLLFGLPFGDDLYHDKPITLLHWSYLAVAVICAIGGPMWPTIRNRWASPAVSASVANAARDARIWIIVLSIFLLYGVAPDIYRRATTPVATTTCWNGKPPPCNEQQTNAPSIQDLTKALESSRQQGAIVANQLGAALIERDKLRMQLDELNRPQNAAHPSSPPASSFETTFSLSQADILKLRDELFKARNALPSVIVLQTADDGQSRGVANALSKAVGLAGIEPGGQSIGYPVTPQETGISIRVPDLEKISNGAKAFADVIKKVTGVEPRYTIGPKPIGEREGGFWIFVGTNPREN